MNGELAQRIALVLHGNEFLAGHPTDVDVTTTFQYVRSIEFEFETRYRLRRVPPVNSARAWFDQLAGRGVQRLELDCIGQGDRRLERPLPDHVVVAFAGGEHSAVLAQRRGATELWRAAWSVAPGERPADNRIWEVTYRGVETTVPIVLVHPSVRPAAEVLESALTSIEHFARTNETGHWADWFAEARDLLAAQDPEIPYHRDLAPPSLDLGRRRLFAAAAKGYVFGGMGSWNDMGFAEPSTQTEYVTMTSQLYRAVMYAFDAATNASAAGEPNVQFRVSDG